MGILKYANFFVFRKSDIDKLNLIEVEEEIKNLNRENNELKSDEYEYGNRQEVKKKIELRLEFVKMKADEFKQISDFRLSSNDYSHSVKNQSAYDAQVTLSNMDFPKDMEYLRNH
ncbi:hypothetical protein RhiirA4_417077 [Rhizophagus irregularis]|uniref:Uncharacterized protein n=1 Tax=Rhizophagus irregularis TaxID=588596 RepID=A0A2I1G5P1_9GLOM|nr:hypothetical protein RhiirA4_417077 [Rhizophagus irregularis]